MLGSAASIAQGGTGLALGYAAVAAPMVVGMVRSGASRKRLLAAPLYAVPVTAAAGVGLAMLRAAWGCPGDCRSACAAALHGGRRAAAAAGIGYVAGRVLAQPAPPHRSIDEARWSIENEQHRDDACTDLGKRSLPRSDRAAITPWQESRITEQDETKHFKIIGTTGTGKSTAITEILSAAWPAGTVRSLPTLTAAICAASIGQIAATSS